MKTYSINLRTFLVDLLEACNFTFSDKSYIINVDFFDQVVISFMGLSLAIVSTLIFFSMIKYKLFYSLFVKSKK